MKTSKRTLPAVAAVMLAVTALMGPVPGHARDGYRSDGPVAVHYRDRGGDRYRHADRDRHHWRHDRAYGRHYAVPPRHRYRSYYNPPRYYGPRYYTPRYYTPRHYYDGRGVWDFTLRYHFYD
ncbi:MAG: hypothetical protein WCY26_08770 [Thiohalobacteraceae bacterium]|nr:hypothetical protein [Gammaproteobacteria bacterium]